MGKFYLTTTLPYVNAAPHIGFALEIVQADVLARWRRQKGDEVIFNTGTDEHGQKIYKAAQLANLEPKAYCDNYAAKFHGLKDALNLTYTHFIRTTDEHHVAAAQEFWKRCSAKDDIYKKQYQVKYCVGCELEKTDSELVDGRCPIHTRMEIELRDEENYFFRWSKYREALLELYGEKRNFIIPENRLNEIRSFVEAGLNDFSVSRLASKMPWGIPVPGDPNHVMYVWFDALVNYISTLGWPDNEKGIFKDFWPGLQLAGKDNLRQQSAMWQAMLLSAGLEPSRQIFIHGFITANGQKMSKSLGNVVDPYDLVDKYGTDAVRYYLLTLPAYEDGDFSRTRFEERYSHDLANTLGNLVNRVVSMSHRYFNGRVPETGGDGSHSFLKEEDIGAAALEIDKQLNLMRFDLALERIWRGLIKANKFIEDTQPFKLIKMDKDAAGAVVYSLLEYCKTVAVWLEPFLPETSEKIMKPEPEILFPPIVDET